MAYILSTLPQSNPIMTTILELFILVQKKPNTSQYDDFIMK